MNCVGEVIKSETLQVLKKWGTLVLFSFNRKLSRRFTKWIKVKWRVGLDPSCSRFVDCSTGHQKPTLQERREALENITGLRNALHDYGCKFSVCSGSSTLASGIESQEVEGEVYLSKGGRHIMTSVLVLRNTSFCHVWLFWVGRQHWNIPKNMGIVCTNHWKYNLNISWQVLTFTLTYFQRYSCWDVTTWEVKT